MEMNRYLIAALYVMAGCVVTIPLKVQGSPEPMRGERCRLVITDTVKVVSAYLDTKIAEQLAGDLPAAYYYAPNLNLSSADFSFDRTVHIKIGALCYSSHQIRAPEAC